MIPDEERAFPETREDAEILTHRLLCRCDVCKRPAAQEMRRRAMVRQRIAARS